jgi:transglutaminase-like putative cysteine protease
MKYHARHATKYSYEGPVSHSLSEVRLTPRILPYQNLLDWRLDVEPVAVAITSRQDYFGNDVGSFAVYEAHTKFAVVATSLVEVSPRTPDLDQSAPWESASPDEDLTAIEFRYESPFIPWVDDLATYASECFAPRLPVWRVAEALMRHIHRDFAYKPKATTIDTPLVEVFRDREGVCQDFAHIMIGALRARGLAARYVSGYLRGDANFAGAQASHAWVSVYSPGAGWLDFDPTNRVLPGEGHLTLAYGRDYGDVTPVKGISIGGGRHKLDVEVLVEPA